MKPTPTGSFFRFAIGFLVFIAVFFGVTIAVQNLSAQQQSQQEAAAAITQMLK